MHYLWVIAITFSILWTPISLAAVPDRPEPELLFLENEAMKIWIDRSMGGSIRNFGPHRKFTPKATSIDGPCMHLAPIAPIATVRLGPTSTLEYRYWMVVGNKAEITRQIDLLLKKYPNPKLVLIEADGR